MYSCSSIGSGNISSGNINSGNITYNIYCHHGDTDSPENYAKIMQCLYSSGYEEHRGRVQTPVEGTCAWVTEHPKYREWFENKTSGVLWLSGDPGCGKSVIASFLIAHLKAQTDATVCYFFFKDDSEEQRSAPSALCAVLHQLFFQNKSLHVYAQEAFDAKGRRFTQEAVAEGGCGDVICVVDALDECEEATLTPLIRYMELGSPATTIRLNGEDEVISIAADVTRVIYAGIMDLESCWVQPGGLGYLRDLLESSADRTFLWVSLVLGILKESEDGSPEEFTNIVSTTPRDLAELYTKILDKTKYPDKARLILNIVVAAARPLTLREMNVTFRISRDGKDVRNLRDLEPGFQKTVKNYCGLFVRIIDSKVYLVHQTAREFLIKRSSSGEGNWQYTMCPKDSNFILADICITYLSREDFENVSFMIGTSGEVEQGTLDEIQKYSFLDYASRFWADHFRDSGDRQMEFFESTRLICEAGSKRLLTWLQVYWLDAQGWYTCPDDLTHLMIASWFGQGPVVERLLGEGGDNNALCKLYGTALNIAAVRHDEGITRILMRNSVEAYIRGKWYNVLQVKQPLPLK
ncbi:hypothetical protein C7212DRAFT_359331 [Tuber magnatum]|uniref:Uncharacterized protein n=1 Tax=Tuber magnatum TaxID=42249 RepID=A0A317SKP4_9PEZI|nr:hypothetical protein C7212DRAFT_359331 [Tuber magnatum]